MLSVIYGLACVIVPCTVYQFFALCKHPLTEHKWRHLLWTAVLLAYIYIVFAVSDIGTVWNFIEHDLTLTLKLINIVPFHEETTASYLLNLFMFVPLGFLLPLIWWEMRNMKTAIATGFFFSLAIELSQLCNNRYSDIDDLLMNTIGVVLGYFLWMFTWKIFSHDNERAVSIEKKEPEMLLTLASLGYFFLYNWRLLS